MKNFKKAFLTVCILTLANFSNGQYKQGNWVIGADGRIATNSFFLGTYGSAKIGYFVRPKIELGLRYSYGQINPLKEFQFPKINAFGLEHYARYYVLNPDSKLNLFGEAGFQLYLMYNKSAYQTYFYLETNLSAGLHYFISPKIALETKVGFNPNFNRDFRMNVAAGINFKLGK